MAYCNYTFYTTSYYGKVIAEADFQRLSERASEKIDQLTFDRITMVDGVICTMNEYGNATTVDSKLNEKIKKATCKVAEILSDIEKYENANRASIGFESTENGMISKVISSVSSGSESVSYNTTLNSTGNSLVGAVLTDKNAQEKLIYESARDYLSGTGLLYAGF